MVNDPEHPDLRIVGGARGIPLVSDDFEAMDVALSLVPELRASVLAIRLARQAGVKYPLTSSEVVAEFAGARNRIVAGHKITAAEVRKFLVKTDFPIQNEAELASVVYIALNRCNHRERLKRSLEQFDLHLSDGTNSGR